MKNKGTIKRMYDLYCQMLEQKNDNKKLTERAFGTDIMNRVESLINDENRSIEKMFNLLVDIYNLGLEKPALENNIFALGVLTEVNDIINQHNNRNGK